MTAASVTIADQDEAATHKTGNDAPTESEAAKPTSALIVFGTDKDGKPHASWFAEPDVVLATKAAGVMGMRALPLETEEHNTLATELTQGRVFASGRAFVPFVKKGLYERLSALAGPTADVAAKGETAAQGPAVAVSGTGDDSVKPVAVGETLYPRSWAGIAVGSLVLISEGEQDGWYEAEIVEAKTGGIFTLRWRDWPDLPLLVRRRDTMALLHPNTGALAAA